MPQVCGVDHSAPDVPVRKANERDPEQEKEKEGHGDRIV
jgi:hypothetical protein